MERWKDIHGYEGYYQVSDLGRIRNTATHKILTGDTNSMGYRRVILYQPIKKRFFVHRLVAMHFCGGYMDGFIVNHIDGNKLNNAAINLEWVTRSQNDKHAYGLNLRVANPCTFKHRVLAYDKNTLDVVMVYENSQECADALRVSRSNVYQCCSGVQKSCRGYVLRYE